MEVDDIITEKTKKGRGCDSLSVLRTKGRKCTIIFSPARVVELVDTGDLKSPDHCDRVGSNPTPGTRTEPAQFCPKCFPYPKHTKCLHNTQFLDTIKVLSSHKKELCRNSASLHSATMRAVARQLRSAELRTTAAYAPLRSIFPVQK